MKTNVLLIDDDIDFCAIVKRLTYNYDVNWVIAHTNEHGIEEMKKKTFDAMLVDYKILGGSCEKIIEESKIYQPKATTIIISGFLNNLLIDSLSKIKPGITFCQKPDVLTEGFFNTLLGFLHLPKI